MIALEVCHRCCRADALEDNLDGLESVLEGWREHEHPSTEFEEGKAQGVRIALTLLHEARRLAVPA